MVLGALPLARVPVCAATRWTLPREHHLSEWRGCGLWQCRLKQLVSLPQCMPFAVGWSGGRTLSASGQNRWRVFEGMPFENVRRLWEGMNPRPCGVGVFHWGPTATLAVGRYHGENIGESPGTAPIHFVPLEKTGGGDRVRQFLSEMVVLVVNMLY
jgi:hypothetical protein